MSSEMIRKQPSTPVQALSRADRRRQTARQRVIAEANKLYFENGGENGGVEFTTVEMICERADISVRTFFRLFESKLDVIYLDHQRSIQDLADIVERRLNSDSPEHAILDGHLEQFERFTADSVNRDRLLRALGSKQFAERQAVWRMRIRDTITQLVLARLGPGPVVRARAEVMVHTLFGLFDAATLEWARAPSKDYSSILRATIAHLPGATEAVVSAAKSGKKR